MLSSSPFRQILKTLGKRRQKHATSATNRAKTCTSSTQVRRKEIRPSVGFLSQHMRPQSCWLSHVVILSFPTNSEHRCGKRRQQHATSATTTANACTSSTQVRRKEIRPSVGFLISAYAPSVMLAKSCCHPLPSNK